MPAMEILKIADRIFMKSRRIDNCGNYFRNQWFETKHRWPDEWQDGIDSIETCSKLFWIAEIAAALIEVQNGVKAPLLRANPREPV